jgi:hypothetical protein
MVSKSGRPSEAFQRLLQRFLSNVKEGNTNSDEGQASSRRRPAPGDLVAVDTPRSLQWEHAVYDSEQHISHVTEPNGGEM